MCAKPFLKTKNEGKLFLVPKTSGPLLERLPLKFPGKGILPNSSVKSCTATITRTASVRSVSDVPNTVKEENLHLKMAHKLFPL